MADAATARFNVAVKGVSLTLPSHLLNSNDDRKEMTMIIFMIAEVQMAKINGTIVLSLKVLHDKHHKIGRMVNALNMIPQI